MPGRFRYYGELLVRILQEEDYGRHLEALAEALPVEVAATDGKGRVIVWNRALARVAGPRERALGRPLMEALPWLQSDPYLDWHDVLDDVLRTGASVTYPRRPLGDRVVRITLGPMQGKDGRPLGAVLSLEDITPGARAAEQQRRRDRDDAIHDLGAALAHEVRNPLNALSLNLQLLAERVAQPDVTREDVEARIGRMIDETKRMEALITHLLEVSRGGPIERAPAYLDDIVRSVVDRLEGTARAKGCEIHVALGSARELSVDAQRVDRALHNLVRNALEAAVQGGRQVWITTRDDPHSTVVVVDDDGPGIRPEDRSQVFGVYTTGKRGGTGLGLPLAQEDIRRQGGEIEVLARPGGGARFVVHFPTASTAEDGPWHAS